jgi:hypothetical protein
VADEANWINASKGTPWTTPGGDYLSKKIVEIFRSYENDDFGWMNINVLEPVKYFIANPDKNFGFLLRNTKLAQEIDIATSEFEYPDSSWRPKLIVEYPAGTVNLTQKQVGPNRMQRPVTLLAINRKLHVANNSTTTVVCTLYRLDGTIIASEMLMGGMSKILSPRNGGVYLLSVSGNNFTVHENLSFFHLFVLNIYENDSICRHAGNHLLRLLFSLRISNPGTGDASSDSAVIYRSRS